MSQTLDRRTLQEQVFVALRARIVQGELLPGSRIVEGEESARFGVSRATLREALRQLEEQGLVVRDPRRVAHVRKLNPDEIVHLYQVRGALEVLAAESICALPQERRRRVIAELRACAQRLSDAVSAGDAYEEVAADLDFHEKLCESSGNGILLDQWRQLAALIRAMLSGGHTQLSISWAKSRRNIPNHHEEIVDALEAHHVEKVAAILREGFKVSSHFLASNG